MQIIKAMTKRKGKNIVRTSDVPINAKMLYNVRDELKSLISNNSNNIKSLDSRIDSLESRIDRLDKKWDARFDDMQASFHRALTLAEQQANENRYVMDKLMGLDYRQDQLENKVGKDVTEIKSMILLVSKHP